MMNVTMKLNMLLLIQEEKLFKAYNKMCNKVSNAKKI